MKKQIILLVSLFCVFYLKATNDTIYWSELRNQNNVLPGENDIIEVNSNDLLILNDFAPFDTMHVKGILVYGGFQVASSNMPIVLKTDWILMANEGWMKVGEESNPFDGNFHLILSGDPTDVFSLDDLINQTSNYISTGGSEPIPNEFNYSMLESMVGDDLYSFVVAMGQGTRMDFISNEMNSKISWSQLNASLRAGEDVITLKDDCFWEVGDEIVIASTDFDMNQAETFSIVSKISENSYQLDHPAVYNHFGEVEQYSNGAQNWTLDMRAEVGLLNRNIKISGEVDFDSNLSISEQPDYFGGNTMAKHGGSQFFNGVEFSFMGQGGALGRYPVHWHMGANAENQYVKNCAIHHTFNKGITVHGTHKVLLENNVVFESSGHSYFLEDGGENANQFLHNLAISTRNSIEENFLVRNSQDDEAASFWIENALNIFNDNHSAGSESRGFWFEMRSLNGESNNSDHRQDYLQYNDRSGPMGADQFKGNRVHSTFNAFVLNHQNYVMNDNYRGTDENPQIVNEFWEVNDLTVYKSELGIWIRGIGGDFNNAKIAEVGTATRFRLNQSINNSLIVGRTSNTGNPEFPLEITEGRTLPRGASDEARVQERFTGHQLYDGPAGANNTHFVGFTGPNDVAIIESNAVHKATTHYVNNVTFDAAIPEQNKLHFDNAIVESKGLIDLDGCLTGDPGAFLVGPSSRERDFYTTDNFQYNSDWNCNINASGKHFGSMKLIAAKDKFLSFNTSYELQKISNSHTLSLRNLEADHGVRDQSLFVADDLSVRNRIVFENPADTFQMYVNDIPFGSSVIYEIEGLDVVRLQKGFEDDKIAVNQVATISDLNNSNETSYFLDDDNVIHLKIVGELKHGWLFPQPKMTLTNTTYSGQIVYFTPEVITDQNEVSEPEISVFPNPISDYVYVNSSSLKNEEVTINIINTNGEKVYSSSTQFNGNGRINLSDFSEGAYFLTIITQSGDLFTEKIIKISK